MKKWSRERSGTEKKRRGCEEQEKRKNPAEMGMSQKMKRQGYWKKQKERQRKVEQQVKKLEQAEKVRIEMEDERMKEFERECARAVRRRMAVRMDAARDCRGQWLGCCRTEQYYIVVGVRWVSLVVTLC